MYLFNMNMHLAITWPSEWPTEEIRFNCNCHLTWNSATGEVSDHKVLACKGFQHALINGKTVLQARQ